jgi:hypothetical protein
MLIIPIIPVRSPRELGGKKERQNIPTSLFRLELEVDDSRRPDHKVTDKTPGLFRISRYIEKEFQDRKPAVIYS